MARRTLSESSMSICRASGMPRNGQALLAVDQGDDGGVALGGQARQGPPTLSEHDLTLCRRLEREQDENQPEQAQWIQSFLPAGAMPTRGPRCLRRRAALPLATSCAARLQVGLEPPGELI